MRVSIARLFKNARIFTGVEGDDELHNAMLVKDGKIVYVGTLSGAEEKSGHMVRITDLNDALVLPGLIDAHAHLIMFGSSLSKPSVMSKDVAAVQEILRKEAAAKPDAKMVLAQSFLFDALGKRPHRTDLDAAVPDRPVFIDSADLHSCWMNSEALAAIGVTKDTKDPEGGEFERDADGTPTGLAKETAVMEHVWPYIASQLSLDDRLKLLKNVFNAFLQTGVTGAVEMALTEDDLEGLEQYYRLDGGKLPIRVSAHWIVKPGNDVEGQVKKAKEHSDRLEKEGAGPWLRVVGIKIISDGVVDSCTAYLKEPYTNGAQPGPIWSLDQLKKVVTLADKLDLQVAIHAIGDAASDQALEAFEAAYAANGDKPSRRHRMEHLECIITEDIQRLTKLGITASLQPVHADPVYFTNWREQLNDKRADRAFPWSEFVKAGSKIAFGSDTPTAPHHTLPNLYTATTRRSALDPKRRPPGDERTLCLDRHVFKLAPSIRNYTWGGAYSVRQEDEVGTLEPGKSADFCILAVDPFKNGVDTLRQAQSAVMQTWIGGEVKWKRAGMGGRGSGCV